MSRAGSICRATALGAIAAMLFVLSATPAEAADGPDPIAAAVDEAFKPLLKQYDVPGLVVAVTVDGRRSFFTYGVASKASGAPATKDTIFELGSVSKTFTATLVSQAVALGKISLDDHPGQHLPELRGAPIDSANLLNLGTYTAGGLPLQFPDDVPDGGMEAYFRTWTPSAEPGTERRYSNPSIGLLGHIAASAMGGDFSKAAETDIFRRLGLDHTHIQVPDADLSAYAWGYDNADRPIRVSTGLFAPEAYGVKSTAADMIRFVEANIRSDTLDPALRRAVEGTHVGYFRSGEMVQGLGWEQFPYPIALERLLAGNSSAVISESNRTEKLTPPKTPSEPTLFDKTGSTNGFGAYVAFVPARRIGVVMLANRNFPIPARVTATHAVLEALSSSQR